MSNYIRREDAIDAFGLSEKTRKYGGDHSGYDTRMLYEIQDTIESLEPADVVHVVWCKDCKYRENDDFCTGRGFPYQLVPDDGFCDKGERKE